MSVAPSNPPPLQHSDAWSGLARRTKEAAIALAVVGALFVLVPILVGIKYRAEYLSICIWGAAVTFLAWAGALWLLIRGADGEPLKADEARVFALIMGGVFGFLTTFLGFLLGWKWSDTFVSWVNGEGQDGWKIVLVLLAIVGGLAVMFASLQLGRSQERSNSTLRLVMYGYNAVLGGLLLLAILIVVNVLVYLKFPAYADFTSGSMYTLSSRSKNILRGLEKPTTIYVLFPTGHPIGAEMEGLLTDAREVNAKIQVRHKSTDQERDEVQQLQRTYGFAGRNGVLVLYGTEPSVEHRFIKEEDLYQLDTNRFGQTSPDEKQGLKFKGEDVLMTELDFLEQSKKKPVIYFTQGNGELDLKNMDASRVDVGAGVLKERLEKRNIEVKPLTFAAADSKVPDDSQLVVIAGPTAPFSDLGLKALREYMNPTEANKKKGKLLVLLDIVRDQNGMRQTGLESFLADFSVQVGNERILSAPSVLNRNPLQVLVGMNPDLIETNPIASAFAESAFVLYNIRSVQPVSGSAPRSGAERFIAQTLMQTVGTIWRESDLRGDIVQIWSDIVKSNDSGHKLTAEPVSVAVMVSEPAPLNPADPHAAMRSNSQKPRLLVFGDASFASNRFASDSRGGGQATVDLLTSGIDWLRERPSSVGIEPKNRDFYVVSPTASLFKMIVLPGLIAAIAIVGLGTGVWVVRRR